MNYSREIFIQEGGGTEITKRCSKGNGEKIEKQIILIMR